MGTAPVLSRYLAAATEVYNQTKGALLAVGISRHEITIQRSSTINVSLDKMKGLTMQYFHPYSIICGEIVTLPSADFGYILRTRGNQQKPHISAGPLGMPCLIQGE
jgi:hypothetical protein